MKRQGAMVSALLWAVMAASSLSAQSPGAAPVDWTLRTDPQGGDVTQANKLLGALMSPFCPGLTLANCPSVYAETLRVSVRERLDAGEAPDSIVESLVAAFGEGIRGAPRAAGLGLVLWALPAIVLGAGGIVVLLWLRTRGVRGAPTPPLAANHAGSVATPADLARLEAELRNVE
jgi:cytochrome c-type biogenesis protein CcmH